MVLQWNPEQTAVLKLFRRMLRRADSPRRIRVEGPAASGKSALLQEMESLSLARSPNSVMVLAPTNTAADAVGGRTLHRALGIPNNAPYAPLDQAALSELGLGAVRVVLLDNFHQVNPHVLYTADRRFRQAAGSDEEAFGGRIVVVFDDDRSIPPYRNPVLDNGLDYVLDTFSSPVLTLTATYFADPTFGAAVGRLRAGAVSAADRQMYDTRKLEFLEPEAQAAFFLEGAKVCYNKDDCAHFNHAYRAGHPAGTGARTFAREGGEPNATVTVWPGAAVVITKNLPDVVQAGSQGVVATVAAGDVVVRLAEVPEGAAAAPIVMVPDRGDGLPLAAPTAYTVPTAQGLRFDRVLVELPGNGWGGMRLMYAAVARAKSWDGLAFWGGVVPRVLHGEY